MNNTSTNFKTFLIVFILTAAASLITQYNYSHKFGTGWSRLLHVHPNPEIGKIIIKDFFPYQLSLGGDHDGMYSYIIARDPLCSTNLCKDIKDRSSLGFRYRRIFYSLIAGGFGYFSPVITMWGLIIISVLGLALSAGLTAMISEQKGYSPLLSICVLACPGAIEALCILTSDNLALGLAFCGLYYSLSGKKLPAITFLALSILTKEVYYLISLGLALYFYFKNNKKEALFSAILTPIPAILWIFFLHYKLSLPEAAGAWGDLTYPFYGIYKYFTYSNFNFSVLFSLPFITIMILILSILILINSRCLLLNCLITPWLILAFFLSDWIWRPGGDAARALLPLHIFVLISMATFVGSYLNLKKRMS